MDRSTVIYLIAPIYTENRYGAPVPATTADTSGAEITYETRRRVFADVMSVSAAEWFEGGRSGLNPEYRIRMFAPDYQGEPIIEYNGKRYAVYRHYQERTDIIELYAERRKGRA